MWVLARFKGRARRAGAKFLGGRGVPGWAVAGIRDSGEGWLHLPFGLGLCVGSSERSKARWKGGRRFFSCVAGTRVRLCLRSKVGSTGTCSKGRGSTR